jgi:uncharacterized membrane protein SirB2
MPRALTSLRFIAGILFVCIGIASIMHIGPAYILWYSTVSVGLYVILLFIGISILIMPYFYNRVGSDQTKRAAVSRFDYALGITATGVGLMLLLNLILSSSHWQNLEWIPVVLAVYIIICAMLFQKSGIRLHFSR